LKEAGGDFIAFFDDDDESSPSRLREQYGRIIAYEAVHPGARVLCYSNRITVVADEEEEAFQRLAIGRVPLEPSGAVVADYVLGLVKDDGRHCWGMFGSCTLMTRTDTLRNAGGFDVRFRRCAELDLAIRVAFSGAHFIAVNAPLITQHLESNAEGAQKTKLYYMLLLLEKHKAYLTAKKAYFGAWCNVHAQFYYGRRWWWRLWYAAALICFPADVSRERLKRSSLLARLRGVSSNGAAS
jgi:hypothetical protein